MSGTSSIEASKIVISNLLSLSPTSRRLRGKTSPAMTDRGYELRSLGSATLSPGALDISIMDADDLHAAGEERQLVDSLWKECYNEPSSLREKGLVVLPGEDAPQQPPPDVAGKMFEPPLGAWAAARPALKEDSDSDSKKEDQPSLVGPRPSSNANSGS
jgi:hypothetical protein